MAARDFLPISYSSRQAWGALALFAVSITGAAADETPTVVSGAPDDVFVTIYRDNLALITETRTVDLQGGAAKLEFRGVLSSVIPQSAVVTGLGGLERERNFDFDGLSPASLLRRSVGNTVTAVRTSRATGRETSEEATIAAAGQGVALRYANRWEAAWCSGGPEKLIFTEIPEGLRAQPTLSTVLSSAAPAGRKTITLSYLVTGVTWQADYVLNLDENGTTGSITGWLTIGNTAENGFQEARAGVVAGDLSRVFTQLVPFSTGQAVSRACWPIFNTSTDTTPEVDYSPVPPPPAPPPPMAMMAPAPEMARGMADITVTAQRRKAEREELGDYQLYVIPWATSVAARQTKQVSFVDQPNIRFQRFYTFDVWEGGPGPETVNQTAIELRTRNNQENGLGEPLPRGTVRIMQAGRGQRLYGGESESRDVAVDSDWRLQIGQSNAVTSRVTNLDTRERVSGRRGNQRLRTTRDMEHDLANALSEPVTVEVQQMYTGLNLQIQDRGTRHTMKDGLPTWTITIPANSRTTLRYTYSTQDDYDPPEPVPKPPGDR
jgi:hypothetical protein